MTIFSPEAMRNRFSELGEQKAKIETKAAPLIAARDEMAAKYQADLDLANAKIKKAQDGLFEIDQERALIVRALAGSTGVSVTTIVAPEAEPEA